MRLLHVRDETLYLASGDSLAVAFEDVQVIWPATQTTTITSYEVWIDPDVVTLHTNHGKIHMDIQGQEVHLEEWQQKLQELGVHARKVSKSMQDLSSFKYDFKTGNYIVGCARYGHLWKEDKCGLCGTARPVKYERRTWHGWVPVYDAA